MVLIGLGQGIYVRDFCVFDTNNFTDDFLKKKNPTFLFMSTNAEQELPGTNQVIEI